VSGLARVSEVAQVAQIVPSGSIRVDGLTERGEYTDSRIPHNWIVDITEPASILACHLAGEFGYVDDGEITGDFTTNGPFTVVNLSNLP
jgi:hypothetical protein